MSARRAKEARQDSWFSSGFPNMKITAKQFAYLHHRWEEVVDLFPPAVISFLELSEISKAFWLASLSRTQARSLISSLKGEESRPVSDDLRKSLQDFQCSRMEVMGDLVSGCSSCGKSWTDFSASLVGDDVFITCPSCMAVFSLGLGDK